MDKTKVFQLRSGIKIN